MEQNQKGKEIKLLYPIQVSYRFDTLRNSNKDASEVNIKDMWENIRDNIKIAAGESIGYHEVMKKKPQFDDNIV